MIPMKLIECEITLTPVAAAEFGLPEKLKMIPASTLTGELDKARGIINNLIEMIPVADLTNRFSPNDLKELTAFLEVKP